VSFDSKKAAAIFPEIPLFMIFILK